MREDGFPQRPPSLTSRGIIEAPHRPAPQFSTAAHPGLVSVGDYRWRSASWTGQITRGC